ncbi:hypothetical protein [Mangrovihabitans endophyticus]|uniref:Uncharacterized protein n=1 Tax=Mangrovihabitans endophyticus TaxID=1751298 RepID=A0A8J3FMD9_9ACTN|nr:hypothetical protein [Mangrovihabitans endophyticus]GGK75258.1 hypothetical protein GCM10012284_06530 [Mangrovihabitans endophyticus]
MAGEIRITQDDIDSLATKLDNFSEALTNKERDVMSAIMRLAAGALESPSNQSRTSEMGTPEKSPGGRLSDGFRQAFEHGLGTTFRIRPGGAISHSIDGG